ncbi:MAG: hypothetical protein NC251_06660 [Lachnoclostridium sp.]|nr:hypothetical protein [Lachnospira sp.]MCM1248096.1 hypothetical protein [Lachnoclostridium sp.]
MNRDICDSNIFYNELCRRLNPRSGIIQPIVPPEEGEKTIFFDIAYKGDLHFIVSGWIYHGWYYVMRDGQQISESYLFKKPDDDLYKNMQRVIDEVENGKYKNKKTLSEKIIHEINTRQLTSYMNNTKWHELTDVIKEQLCDIPVQYKTLFDTEEPEYYWTIGGDEYFDHMNMAAVEWFKIACEIKESRYRGRLLAPEVIFQDKKEVILQILEKYSIPYEYDEEENAVIIYGYKQ